MPTTIDTGEDRSGVVTGLPRLLLRSEGVALLAMAAVLYARQGQSWWLFAALLAIPDMGLLGYLVGARAGAVAYDLAHTYLPPRCPGSRWGGRRLEPGRVGGAHLVRPHRDGPGPGTGPPVPRPVPT